MLLTHIFLNLLETTMNKIPLYYKICYCSEQSGHLNSFCLINLSVTYDIWWEQAKTAEERKNPLWLYPVGTSNSVCQTLLITFVAHRTNAMSYCTARNFLFCHWYFCSNAVHLMVTGTIWKINDLFHVFHWTFTVYVHCTAFLCVKLF